MPPWLMVLLIAMLVLAVQLFRTAAARADLPGQLRARWGRSRDIVTDIDEGAAEAWALSASPLSASPLSASPLSASPLSASPLSASPLSASPLSASPLSASPADGSGLGVDARTWDDLDLARVLASIDHTETLLGAQALYRRVRNGNAWADSATLEPVATRCASDPVASERIGAALASAGRGLGRGFWRVTTPDAIRLQWWYGFFPLLALAMVSAIAWTVFVDPRALLAVAGLAVLSMAGRAAATLQVPWLLTPIRQMTGVLGAAERLLALDELPSADRTRLRALMEPLRPLRNIGRWVSRDASLANELTASAWEYLNLFLLLDANALLFAGRRLRAHASALAELATWVGEVDMARAVASLRAEPRAWCRPEWTDSAQTTVTGVWHPLVEEPVPNDVSFAAGGGVVITGANMSGKSTYLRAAGVAAVLARALDTCPATSWTGGSVRVRSLIGRADDLASGRSYYIMEAEGVVGLLRDAQRAPHTLYLLDELLRGTNTVERIAAGEAVVRALAAPNGVARGHTVFVATHDGELVTLLRDQFAACHFRETIDASGLHFEYARHEGAARTRTATALLEVCGAPSAVLTAARTRAAELDALTTDLP